MFARIVLLGTLYALVGDALPASAAELKILLPLGRTAYQTNERIDLAVVRDGSGMSLAGGDLVLTLHGEGGGRLSFTLHAARIAPEAGTTRSVEHLHVNGWLLRPGKYTVEVACDGAKAKNDIEVYSHVRRSSF